MTRIYLCKIPFLDVDYANVINFNSESSRRNFFESKSNLNFELNLRKGIKTTDISIPYQLSRVLNYDYMFFNYEGKDYFYFITDKEQINEQNTMMYISKDVFTSHQFDVDYLDSFVDRCHVARWDGNKPTRNTVEEGLDFGENIQIIEPQIVTEFSDSVIMASSVPMGRLESSGGGGSGGGTGNCWEEGKPSPKGFRFIKGFEGIGYKPYQDSGGYWTIGYGVTLHGEPDIYNEFVALANSGQLTEEVCAKKSYDLKVERYGLRILDAFKALGCNNQGQFDALLSLAFNSGNGSITGSNSLTNAIKNDPTNESVIRPIWENFKITSGGVTLPGLIARRKQECNMYFGQEVEIRKIGIVSGGSGYVTENNGNGWLPPECSQGVSDGDYNGYKSFSNAFGSGWLCPVKDGTVTSKYGWRKHPITGATKFHKGTDISNPEGATTVASKNGTVIFAGWNDQGFGNLVILNHDNKYKSYYPHLSGINVKIGDTVERGQVVGLIGSTGDSTGSHCHWEIRDYNTNESTDPAPSLQKGDKV